MRFMAPTVRRGESLTAGVWNAMAQAVNGSLKGPRDLDEGVPQEAAEDQAANLTETEFARTSVTVRFTNPDDATLFVDVEEPSVQRFRRSDGIIVERIYV